MSPPSEFRRDYGPVSSVTSCCCSLRTLQTTSADGSRLSFRPVGSPPLGFFSGLESHSHVPGWSFLHWLRKQHRDIPITDHRNCTSKAPRKGNNSMQHTLVL